MRSIKQNLNSPVALPDFRNLGIAMRVLLLVTGVDILAATLLTENWDNTGEMLAHLLSISLPLAALSLLALYAANRPLSRLTYARGLLTVLLLEAVLASLGHAVAVRVLHWDFMPTLLRFVLFTLVFTAILLDYLSLRHQALTKAFAEARLQALQARIRPHFLFNSINAVLSLFRSDPRRAEEAMEDMADLFRVLMADNRELVPLHTEVDLCCRYLALEKLRLGERLNVTWNIEHMPMDALVPPLVLQPLVENAVYHGIEPSQTGGEIIIDITLSNNEVHIVLTNPYKKDGRIHSGNKMALGNIRERLSLHFDMLANLTAKAEGDHYQVHITLPYRKSEST